MSLILTYEYDRTYLPSFPAVKLTITNPDDESRSVERVALIDSGSDGSMIPREMVRQLKLSIVDTKIVRGITGARVSTGVYLVDLCIGELTFWNIEVVMLDSEDRFILGRDILNHLRVTLDGTALTTEIALDEDG